MFHVEHLLHKFMISQNLLLMFVSADFLLRALGIYMNFMSFCINLRIAQLIKPVLIKPDIIIKKI